MESQPKGLVAVTAVGGSAKVPGRHTANPEFRLLSSVWERRVTRELRGLPNRPSPASLAHADKERPVRPAQQRRAAEGGGGRGLPGGDPPGFEGESAPSCGSPEHGLEVCYHEESLLSAATPVSLREAFWARGKRGLRRALKSVFQIPLPPQLNWVRWGRRRREIPLNDSRSLVIEMPGIMPG